MDKYVFAILFVMCMIAWILLCAIINGVSLLIEKRKAKQEKEAQQQLEMKKRLFAENERQINGKLK